MSSRARRPKSEVPPSRAPSRNDPRAQPAAAPLPNQARHPPPLPTAALESGQLTPSVQRFAERDLSPLLQHLLATQAPVRHFVLDLSSAGQQRNLLYDLSRNTLGLEGSIAENFCPGVGAHLPTPALAGPSTGHEPLVVPLAPSSAKLVHKMPPVHSPFQAPFRVPPAAAPARPLVFPTSVVPMAGCKVLVAGL